MSSSTYEQDGASVVAVPKSRPEQKLGFATLFAACLAVCVAEITIAMPTVLNGLFQSRLHADGSEIAWITDASLLPVTALALTFGVLGDKFGRKRLLVLGAVALIAGHLVTATAAGTAQLWTGRAIAGLGAAALFPTSLAVVAIGTRTGHERARGVTLWAASLAAGAALAPVISGISADNGSWKWAFVVVIALSALSGVVRLFAADSRAPEGRSLDWPGQITIAIGLFALMYAVIQGGTDGWGSTAVVLAFVIAAVFLALFVVVELRSPAPLLRLDVFRNRAFTVSAFVTVVGMFSFVATAYSTSIRLGPVQHQSPLLAAAAFVVLNGVTLVVAPLTSRLIEHVSPCWILSGGLLLTGVGDLWASTVSITDRSLGSLVGPLLAVGLGFALTVTSISAVAVNTVPVRLAGMASGATSLLRDFGFTLGPAVISAVALSRAAGDFTTSLAASALPEHAKAAAAAVAKAGGPLAVNSAPPTAPHAGAVPLAVDALGHGYSLGYLISGIAAVVAALLAAATLGRTVRPVEEPGE
ncbi:MFS transporter [Amycolatopsis sp. NPDC051372]|uniref:MFS transporter n=1 Tax=Amycolatopsis sp. NPDC051372 TaxID=3155669 RepID=UPI00343EDCA2